MRFPHSLAASREAIAPFAAILLFLFAKEILGINGPALAYGIIGIVFVVILVREVPRRILRLAVVFGMAAIVFFNRVEPAWSASAIVGMAVLMATKKVDETDC